MRERLRAMRETRQHGVVTAEYAMGMVAACGLGTVLYKLLTGNTVLGLLTKLVSRAFDFSF